jgi:hypothetical protein
VEGKTVTIFVRKDIAPKAVEMSGDYKKLGPSCRSLQRCVRGRDAGDAQEGEEIFLFRADEECPQGLSGFELPFKSQERGWYAGNPEQVIGYPLNLSAGDADFNHAQQSLRKTVFFRKVIFRHPFGQRTQNSRHHPYARADRRKTGRPPRKFLHILHTADTAVAQPRCITIQVRKENLLSIQSRSDDFRTWAYKDAEGCAVFTAGSAPIAD